MTNPALDAWWGPVSREAWVRDEISMESVARLAFAAGRKQGLEEAAKLAEHLLINDRATGEFCRNPTSRELACAILGIKGEG